MVRITKVYTRAGDKGETSLVGGKRVPKDSARIEAYGTIDELNSIVGLARVFNEESLDAGDAHQFLNGVLCQIQDELFDLGSELATPPEFFIEGMYRVGKDEIERIEKLIDKCQADLEPLKSFILPGGGRIGAYLHQCRTVCRRAEREILEFSRFSRAGLPSRPVSRSIFGNGDYRKRERANNFRFWIFDCRNRKQESACKKVLWFNLILIENRQSKIENGGRIHGSSGGEKGGDLRCGE